MTVMSSPRIAYFPDSFHEVNGVGHTSRNFAAFAERRGLPFLCIRAARKEIARAQPFEQHGEFRSLELRRSALAVPLEADLHFDPLFFRYSDLISETVRAFQPDVIHITGPSELGIFGAYFAHVLKIPLAASWHTNVHEYAARRSKWFSKLFGTYGGKIEDGVEAGVLDATTRFYRLAKVLYAPNPELCTLLERKTDRPCHLMQRGVETEMFTPARRTRSASGEAQQDKEVLLGYVGRLSVEKNVALLPVVDAELRARGIMAKWMIVGHGSEEAALRAAMPSAHFAGVLRGEDLAHAYANMDAFVFPSHTDTFGNVILEALASGVPAVVTPDGGPAHIIRDGITGRIATDANFADAIASVLHSNMQAAARSEYALGCSWDAVFERVIAAYPLAR